MSQRLATLVHINPMEGIIPLAGGYLKAFAETDPEILKSWGIELYSTTIDCPSSKLIRDLVDRSPDVVGFSTYVWNIGLVQRVLRTLRGVLPKDTQYLLGGVEVMNCAGDHLERSWENVSVCNGEGEKTFRQFLRELGGSSPDLSRVGGLTFQRDGQLITTDPHDRIKDLNEIPSPYLSGVFEKKDFAIALLETNRGCPFRCEYCFWGGAIGQKINRLGVDRIFEEIDFLASQKCQAILICDANFGVFSQDVDIARKIVGTRRETGYPLRVSYSSAKNNPDQSLEVATVLAQGSVLTTQPVSLQTMNERALKLAKRGNISTDTYLQLQRRMNEIGVPSFIELIWPLPGETLETFKQGMQDLCEMGAQVFSVYPLVWLRNVGYEGREEQLGIVLLEEADPVGGGRVVIQTNDVSFAEWIDGMIFVNSAMLLYDCRGLFHTSRILNSLGIIRFRELFDHFVAWMNSARENPLVAVWRRGSDNIEDMYKNTWRGEVVEAALHTSRLEFDHMLASFTESLRDVVGAEHAGLFQAAVEFDILSRPYAYANTPFKIGNTLSKLQIVEESKRSYVVDAPYDFPQIAATLSQGDVLNASDVELRPTRIQIDHARGQIFRMPYKRAEDHHQFCHQFVTEIGNSLPVYTTSLCSTARI